MTDVIPSRRVVVSPQVAGLPPEEQAVVLPATTLRRLISRLEEIRSPRRSFSNLGWALAGMSVTCIASAVTAADPYIRQAFVLSSVGLAGMSLLALLVSRREHAHERDSAAMIAEQMRQFLPPGGYRHSIEDRLRYRATAYLSRIVAEVIAEEDLLPEREWRWYLEISGRHIGLRARRQADAVAQHAVFQIAPDWAAGTSLSYATSIAQALVRDLRPAA